MKKSKLWTTIFWLSPIFGLVTAYYNYKLTIIALFGAPAVFMIISPFFVETLRWRIMWRGAGLILLGSSIYVTYHLFQ